eukprot:8071984-Alexandrium_andersonii.AAC.1
MSASLVGSEMCIRDRTSGGPTRRSSWSAPTASPLGPSSRRRRPRTGSFAPRCRFVPAYAMVEAATRETLQSPADLQLCNVLASAKLTNDTATPGYRPTTHFLKINGAAQTIFIRGTGPDPSSD